MALKNGQDSACLTLKMDGLAQMRWFTRLCQICGFHPFRIEIHPETERFQQFTFSYLHPITFWFVFMQILPVVLNLLSFKAIDLPDEIPRLIRMMDYIMKIFYFGYYVLIYSIPLRCWHIQSAAKFIQQLDESLKTSTKNSCNVKPRICIGFAIVLTLVVFNLFSFEILTCRLSLSTVVTTRHTSLQFHLFYIIILRRAYTVTNDI